VWSDALLITGAFYELLSETQIGPPIVFGASNFNAQYSLGMSFAAVATMVSVGLYGQRSFMDFRLLFGKIAVASVIVLMLVTLSETYWREGLNRLTDLRNFPVKATLIWLVCVSVTRGTYSVTLGRGLFKTRVLVLGKGVQAARIAKLVETGQNDHFIAVSFLDIPARDRPAQSNPAEWSAFEPDQLLKLGYRLGASEIVVATDERRGLPVSQLLHCCWHQGNGLSRFLGARDADRRPRRAEA
jgi:FlaA1/EpsC-like NDP-sugar epimerase